MSLEYTQITEDEGELGKIMLRDFMPPFRKGYIRVGPEKVALPEYYLKFADAVKNLEVRDDDVWIMSHPKTGTTWTQEMAWCIQHDLDYEKAKQFLSERFPFLDHSVLLDFTDILPTRPDLVLPPFVSDSVQYVSDMKSPRFIKTHLPWSLLPQQIQDGTKKPKIVYIWRDAKDTCISYYHHCILLEGYSGNFEDFCKLFLGDSVTYNPFWSHVLGFYDRRHLPNVLFLKYEDLKKDLPSVVRTMCEFLGKTLKDEQVDSLVDHLSFESMKNNKSVNYEPVVAMCRELDLLKTEGTFMRSGTVGEWKGKMDAQMLKRFDEWTKEKLKGSDLKV